MKEIIGGNSTGKTKRLLEFAKRENAIVVCKNPEAMRQKAHAYGMTGMHFAGYEAFLPSGSGVNDESIVIDELADFVSFLHCGHLLGYTMTVGG